MSAHGTTAWLYQEFIIFSNKDLALSVLINTKQHFFITSKGVDLIKKKLATMWLY